MIRHSLQNNPHIFDANNIDHLGSSSILEDLHDARVMASAVDGSPSHGGTSGESSKESIPLMDGEVPEGVPRGEPLTKAAADRSTVETHTQLSP